MAVEIIEKEAFLLIGRQGRSAPLLWQDAIEHLPEILHLVALDDTGGLKGVWGVCSGETVQDYYLAGFETEEDVCPPTGWEIWQVPENSYAVAACNKSERQMVDLFMEKKYFPAFGYRSAGAALERYPQKTEPGTIEIYYPFLKL